MSNGGEHNVRRGPNEPNPIQQPPLVVWRGGAEGVPRMPHSEQDPHDFGDGLYLTYELWLAEQYSRLRASPENRPIVQTATIPRELLGRVLDLTSDTAGQEWEEFLATEYVPGRTWRSLLPPTNPNRNYWTVFSEFMRSKDKSVENYDTIIGPEYVRTGVQLCVRNQDLQRQIQARFTEYDIKPLWVRVLDAQGAPVDVNVNDARNGAENRRFVEERLSNYSREFERRTGSAPQSGPPRPPTFSPGARIGAGILAVLEIARYILEIAAIYKSMPPAIQQKLRPVRTLWAFWREYEVRATVLGLVTSGDVAARGMPGVQPGTVIPASGRMLSGITPDALDKMDEDDIEFFLAFVDNFASPNPSANALKQNLTDLRRLMLFLAHGWDIAAVVPLSDEAKRPLHRIRSWWVRTRIPASEGSTELKETYYSLEEVLERIRATVMALETTKIQGLTAVDTPAASRVRQKAGLPQLPVNRSRVLRYRSRDDRAFYSTMYLGGSPTELGGEDTWGSEDPTFYQVGEENIGDPFYFERALLVTGADAETNAMLYGCLAQKDRRALVAAYEPTLSPDWPAEPSAWVNAPLVYVERDDLQ